MSSGRKTRIDYRSPGAVAPPQPSRWRERGTIVAAGVIVLLLAIILLSAQSTAVVITALIIDGSLLALWLLACAGFGGTLCRGDTCVALVREQKGETSLAPTTITRVALGIGIIGLLQLLLGLAGAIHRATAFAIIAIGIALLLFNHRKLTRHDIVAWFKAPADWEWLWLCALPLLAMAIVAAYVPPGILWGDEPHGYDVLEYHLQLPREWYELGEIVPLKHNVFSYFPLAVEMHYLLAMQLLGGPWKGMYLAQLMHVAMVALTVIAIYSTARQFAPKLPSMLAALAAAATPWMLLLGSVAYNEGGLLLFGTLAIGWALRAAVGATLVSPSSVVEEGDTSVAPTSHVSASHRWIIAGVFAGLACGTKLTAVPLLLILLPLIALLTLRAKLTHVAFFILAGTLVFSPWLIRNALWTGNPVFPEAQSIFGRGHFSEEQAERWKRAHSPTPRQRYVTAHFDAAQDQILLDFRFGHILIPAGVVAAIIARRRPQARLVLALLAAYLIFWLGFTHLQGRFFVLAIPLAALALALLQYRPQQWQMIAITSVIAIHILLGAYLSFNRFADSVHPLAVDGLLGFQDFKPMLAQEYIDAIDRDQPVILVGDARAFLYQVPMSRLFYRTVFDVDVKERQGVVAAWMEGAPAGVQPIVDRTELERFSKTYYAIPTPD